MMYGWLVVHTHTRRDTDTQKGSETSQFIHTGKEWTGIAIAVVKTYAAHMKA